MQWHPFFVSLLRVALEDYYEIRTELPVGDLPRQADLALLRRTALANVGGVFQHLTTWNVFEFKGPTDSPALDDLDLLLELGLGIHRRLNDDRRRQGQPLLERAETSWWYLANHLGRRFLAEAERLLGSITKVGDGLWRCPAFGHELWLVSRDDLPVDEANAPMHLVTRESHERELALGEALARQAGSWRRYGAWLMHLHPEVWKEVQQMIRTMGDDVSSDLRPLIKIVGLKTVIDQVGLKELVAAVGVKQLIAEVGVKQLIAEVGVKQLIAEVGVKQLIAEVGVKQLIAEVGVKQLIAEVGAKPLIAEVGLKSLIESAGAPEIIATMGVDWFLAHLTPEQLEELQRRRPRPEASDGSQHG